MFPDVWQQLVQATAPPPPGPALAGAGAPRKKQTPEQALEATLGPAAGQPIAIPNLPPVQDDAPQGFNAGNAGAFLPPGPGPWAAPSAPSASQAQPPGMGATLARQMMERPSVPEKQEEFRRMMAGTPRSAQAVPMPGLLGMAGMNQFVPESEGDYHARGLKAFEALDRSAGLQEKQALEKYLGVGQLGLDTTRTALQGGQLEVAQRGQQEQERKGAHERDRNTEAMKLIQAMLLGGKSQSEALQGANLLKAAGPQSGFEPGGFQVNAGNPTARPKVQDVGSAQDFVSGRVTPPPPPGGSQIQNDAITELMRHQNALGLNAWSKAEGAKTLPEAAVALHAALQDREMAGRLPAVEAYLTSRFGSREWEKFLNPTRAFQGVRAFSNAFTPPSAEEVLMSMIRNAKGMGPARTMNDLVFPGAPWPLGGG